MTAEVVDAIIKEAIEKAIVIGLELNKDQPVEIRGALTAQALAYRVLKVCIEQGLDNEDKMVETMQENLFAI